MKRRCLFLLLILTGCSGPSVSSVAGEVEILDQKIVDAQSDTGAPIKKLVLRWKNVGRTPVTYIVADVDTLDAQGNVTDHDEGVNLYSLSEPIQPGQEHRDRAEGAREGMWVYQKDAGAPHSARIRITSAGSE